MADETGSSSRGADAAMDLRTWVIATLLVVLGVGVAALLTWHRQGGEGHATGTVDGYASHLPITGLSLAEATNGAGGKSTYVDGVVRNTGEKTVVGATVQVAFATVDGTPAHRETLPLALIRTREPYVDLEPMSAEPLRPGDQREFRLIFEEVPGSWDVKPPVITVISTKQR